MRMCLENKFGTTFVAQHAIHSWILKCASYILRYVRVGGDRMTALERIKGPRSKRPRPEFGEMVLYRPLATSGAGDEARYVPGFFVGMWERSDELILIDHGLPIRACEYRRMVPAERWQKSEVENL